MECCIRVFYEAVGELFACKRVPRNAVDTYYGCTGYRENCHAFVISHLLVSQAIWHPMASRIIFSRQNGPGNLEPSSKSGNIASWTLISEDIRYPMQIFLGYMEPHYAKFVQVCVYYGHVTILVAKRRNRILISIRR